MIEVDVNGRGLRTSVKEGQGLTMEGFDGLVLKSRVSPLFTPETLESKLNSPVSTALPGREPSCERR